MMAKIRSLKNSDYSDIYKINENEHPNYELDSKIKYYPEGCFVADLDGIVGYLISFPYVIGKPYPIDEKYEFIENPNCQYIYDLSVISDFQNKGIEDQLAEKTVQNGWPTISVVTIREQFWKNFGFLSFKKIEYYGIKAHYMLRVV